MAITIQPYSEQNIPTVKAFNARLQDGGVSFQFPERHEPDRFRADENSPIRQEYFLAVENDDVVRGGYILKQQEFLVGDDIIPIGNYQLPLSEGTIDRQYNVVGLQMLTDALKRQPLLYALGMGGVERPLPKMLTALGWRVQKIPFLFRVCRPNRCLREISYLRSHPSTRLLCDLAAVTGLGWLGIKSVQASRKKKPSRLELHRTEVVDSFGDETDRLWDSSLEHYSFSSVATQRVLTDLYPPSDDRFIRLLVKNDDGDAVAWAVVLDTQMSGHKQFGDMRVGSIVDCMAAPESADTIIATATDFLESRGVDIIVTNQAHPWWCSALASAGFLEGPSNFALATSKELTRCIAAVDPRLDRLHINRGDGDGPINL